MSESAHRLDARAAPDAGFNCLALPWPRTPDHLCRFLCIISESADPIFHQTVFLQRGIFARFMQLRRNADQTNRRFLDELCSWLEGSDGLQTGRSMVGAGACPRGFARRRLATKPLRAALFAPTSGRVFF